MSENRPSQKNASSSLLWIVLISTAAIFICGCDAFDDNDANPGGANVIVVVDKDIDILNPHRILHAIGARWQPSAHVYVPQTLQRAPSPSLAKPGLTSKMIIY